MKKRIIDLLEASFYDESFAERYGLEKWDWRSASRQLQHEEELWQYLDYCGYRPFNNRFMYYSAVIMDRIRPELRRSLFKKDNLCLVCSRQVSGSTHQHFFVTNLVPNDCLISNITKESNHNFPLFLYLDI